MTYHTDPVLTLGDVLVILPSIPDNHYDACLCDPPYLLEFMGKEFDRQHKSMSGENDGQRMYQWHLRWCREVFRVLKPGAFILTFGGTRTSHRLACALEDVGFEIRDMIEWLYGSGFPKSTDISKQIDKRGGYPHLAKQIGNAIKQARESRGLTVGYCDKRFCGGTTNWTWFEGRPKGQRAPTPEIFSRISREWPELEDLRLLVDEAEREIVGHRTGALNNSETSAAASFIKGSVGYKTEFDITIPASEQSALWSGYGTALKPSHEPLIWARKPLTTVPICALLSETTHLLGGLLCQAFDVSSADESFMSSLPVQQEVSASVAQIVALVHGLKSGVSLEEMGTCSLPETASMCLSIAISWNGILDVSFSRQNTFTTKTETVLTTTCQILRSLILEIIPEDIIKAVCLPVGSQSSVSIAGQNFNDETGSTSDTLNATALALATWRQNVSGTSVKNAENSLLQVIRSVFSVLQAAIASIDKGDLIDYPTAHEPLILAMKPCIGTFAENAIESGVAGLNIDGCRIGTDTINIHGYKGDSFSQSYKETGSKPALNEYRNVTGRWPANLILSHYESCLESECHPLCPVRLLDEQSGNRGGGSFKLNRESGRQAVSTTAHNARNPNLTDSVCNYGDSGGASRFFYCAKVSTRERNIGGIECKHPTLKPVDLCRYLATLLLPPSRSDNSPRRMLIPFSGAGSEVTGAQLAGWDYIHGIEQDPEYHLSSLYRTKGAIFSMSSVSRDKVVHSSLSEVKRLGLDAEFPGYPASVGIIIRRKHFGGHLIESHVPKLSSLVSGETLECDTDDLDTRLRLDLYTCAENCRELAADLVRHAERLESRAKEEKLIDDSTDGPVEPQNLQEARHRAFCKANNYPVDEPGLGQSRDLDLDIFS